MAWLILVIAGLFEVGFTTCLELSDNFTKPIYSVGFFLCAIISFILLNKAIQQIPLGTAYAVWTGIGAAGTVLVGTFLFQEPISWIKVALLSLLIGAIIGLKALPTT